MTNQNESRYFQLVDQFLQSESKASVLNQAHSFSENLSDDALLPEEFVDIHRKYVQKYELSREDMIAILDILRAVIGSFGYDYEDYKALVDRVEVHDKELDVASRLQQTMLKTNIPQFDGIQIGVISVAAQHVSGDYFNLIDHKDGTMSFAVADVIGKGIPAALAMSMIKFGMDSYGHSQLPNDGLKRLNRVVEKNINQNMFVTMFYGLYEEINRSLL